MILTFDEQLMSFAELSEKIGKSTFSRAKQRPQQPSRNALNRSITVPSSSRRVLTTKSAEVLNELSYCISPVKSIRVRVIIYTALLVKRTRRLSELRISRGRRKARGEASGETGEKVPSCDVAPL